MQLADDAFGIYSPSKKKTCRVATTSVVIPDDSDERLQERARNLASEEMKLWKTRSSENTVKKPLLPTKKEELPDSCVRQAQHYPRGLQSKHAADGGQNGDTRIQSQKDK